MLPAVDVFCILRCCLTYSGRLGRIRHVLASSVFLNLVASAVVVGIAAVEITEAEIAFDLLVVVVCWRLSSSSDTFVPFVALSFYFAVLLRPTSTSSHIALPNVPVQNYPFVCQTFLLCVFPTFMTKSI